MIEKTNERRLPDDGRSTSHDRVPAAVTAGVLAVVALLTAATLWGAYDSGTSTRMLSLDVVVGLTACALTPVLLRWPVAGAVLLAGLAAISPAGTPGATLGTLHVAGRRPIAQAGAVAAIGVTAHLVRNAWRPTGGISWGWWVLLVVVAHAALLGWGALSQARRALICSLRERAVRAEAEQGRRVAQARAQERSTIAYEMHDVLAHRLSLLATYAGALEYRPDAPPERLARAAGVVRAGVHEALEELRDVIQLLRDDTHDQDAAHPDGTSGSTRPQPSLSDLPRLVQEARDAGQVVELDMEVDPTSEPSPALGRTAFRVVQEGLTNARKHAAGEPVRVRVEGGAGTGLLVAVRNPLVRNGSESGPLVPGSGTGLVGLTERVRLAGGQLDHQQDATDGFRLLARLPWPHDADHSRPDR